MTVIKDDTKQMEGYVTLCSWIGRTDIVKMAILPKIPILPKAISLVKLPMAFLTTRTKKFFLICLETYNTSSRQSNLCLMELGVSGFLISDYPIKLQSEKLCGTGTKPEI